MILALESSCDETALALFDPAGGVEAEWVHSQVAIHGEYGGVVPDLAAREHAVNFPVMLGRVFAEEGARIRAGVRRIAVTQGPGLAACLAMGVAQGKALCMALGVPLTGVNHLRGHAFSPFIAVHAEAPREFDQRMLDLLPHLGLIVSGGNTLLFRIEKDRSIAVLGQTVDDAAGEALDKGAKLLGLGYPGGPLVERLAKGGDPGAFAFPRAFAESGDLKFSFSGLKTSLRYTVESMDDAVLAGSLADLCASYQQAVVDALIRKVGQALKRGPYRSLGLSGGVANNSLLRDAFAQVGARRQLPALFAERRHTGDNAAMIAFAAHVDPIGCVPAPRLALSFNPSARLA